MIIIAPKSSITANAVKNILSEVGTRFPNNDNIPNAKAMSVAIGIPAPDCNRKLVYNVDDDNLFTPGLRIEANEYIEFDD